MSFNRIANCGNIYQGKYKRVLCVCSAGLLRSPTAALVLSQEPYNYNTRAAGLTAEFALIPVDDVLLHWADEVVCMNAEQEKELNAWLAELGFSKTVIDLDIEDSYRYRDEHLMNLIRKSYDNFWRNKL
jgi:predicted protein tyrosine phosphatase